MLDPVQRGFMECHGLQCGFCTPGMLLTARALLDRDPDPSEQTIREAISGQICRCTGYATIVRSVRWAAEHPDGVRRTRRDRARRGARRAERDPRRATVGCSARRTGAWCAAAGRSPTTSSCPGCSTWRSCAPRWRTPGSCPVDTLAAEAHPKVRAVVTGAMLEERGLAWMPTLPGDRQPVLATDKVRFQGQEVAFVVAEDRYAARDALELIDVEYDVLPPVVDSRRALDPDTAADPRRHRRQDRQPLLRVGDRRRGRHRRGLRPGRGRRSRRRSSSPACTRLRWRPAARWPTTTGSTSRLTLWSHDPGAARPPHPAGAASPASTSTASG